VLRFVLTRVAICAFVVLGAASLTFLTFRLLRPELYAGEPAPLPGLAEFLWRLVQGDLGRSPEFGNRPVMDLLVQGLPTDLWLMGGGLVLGVLLGLAGGAVCGLRPRAARSRVLEAVALLALCAPVYWLGIQAIFWFSADVGRLPVPFLGGQGAWAPFGESPSRWLQGMLLPWIVLALPVAAACLRMLRATLPEVLDEDFVRTADGKGLRPRTIVRRHVVPVGAPPVLSLGGVLSAAMVGNAVLIEQVFNIPGVLRTLTNATGGVEGGGGLDVPVLQGCVIAGATVVALAVLASEVVHAWLDPRVRR
jgi:peptide/nickel transport system permease protein